MFFGARPMLDVEMPPRRVSEPTLARPDGGGATPRVASGTPPLRVLAHEPGVAARAEAQLRRLAYHDPLTGLPNRVAMSERIEVALDHGRPRPAGVGVLLLSLEGFQLIEDGDGYVNDEELLIVVAGRLSRLAAEGVTAGRDANDGEFLLLADNLPADDDGARNALRLLGERIADLLAEPFVIAGSTVRVTAAIGASLYPTDAGDAGALVRHASQAIQEAKQRGRAQVELYDATHRRSHVELQTALRVRRALGRGEFELYYQPVIEIADGGGLGGLEALLRWNEPQRGLLTPGAFMPHLDDSQLLAQEITDWVFKEVCRQLADWRRRGFDPRVSFNIPARQLRRADLAHFIINNAELYGADLTRLAAEVTETSAVDLDTITPTLAALRDAGLVISLDDFGIGYSSLWRLRSMPFSLLKTDLSLMRGVPDDAEATQVLEAVVSLGKALGMVVIVEGVEAQDQVDALLRVGARVAQGYHLGRPAPAAEIEARWGPAGPAIALSGLEPMGPDR
jgi:diguanylate cyclase (GGDEF)-like protein